MTCRDDCCAASSPTATHRRRKCTGGRGGKSARVRSRSVSHVAGGPSGRAAQAADPGAAGVRGGGGGALAVRQPGAAGVLPAAVYRAATTEHQPAALLHATERRICRLVPDRAALGGGAV